jgi:16S rRNA (uracil1498-N3)-methyltransferase
MTEPALPAHRRASAAHVFVQDIDAPIVGSDDRHHLERVLRLRTGEFVTVSDGRGRWRWARMGTTIEPVAEVQAEPAPVPALTIAFGVLKGDRNELIVQKLTELGIDRIVPMLTDRCVVRWDPDRAARQRERLARVAREAAMQSRRVWLPEVAALTPFGAFSGDSVGRCCPDGAPPLARHTTLLVGPEGGWSGTEDDSPLPSVRIADQILRAETAAITAGVFVAAIRSGLVIPYAT